MVVGNVASLLPLTGDLSALVCLTDSGELHILKRADEDGNVPLQNNSDNQATVPDLVGTSTCPLYGTAWSSERGVGKLVDAAPIQQGDSVMMLTIHDGASVASNQPLSFCRNKSKQASLLTWSPDPVPELLFEGIPGEAENVTSMWALQNDRGYDAAIIISSSSGTRIVEADSKGTFIDVTDDVVELDSGSETLAAGNISTSGGWAAQVTGTAVIAFKPFDRSIISAKKWFVPSNFHIGAVTVTGGTVVMHVLIDGSNHLLLLRLEGQVNVASDESSSDECQASWTIMSDMPLEHEASCISNVISGVPLQTNSGCHLFLGVGTYKPSILLIRISCTCNSWAMDIVNEFLLCSPTSNGRASVTKMAVMAVDPRHSSDYTGEKDVVLGLPAMLILQPSPLKVTPAVDDVQPLRMIDVWMTLRNGVFQHVRCSMNASSGGVSWSPVYKISDSGSVPPAMLLLPQQSTAGSSYSVMTMTTDAATLYSTLQDSAGIDFIRLKLPFAMLNIALPLNLPSNDSSMNSFLTCRQDGALCLLSLNPPVESHIVSKLCPLPDAFVPTGLFASKLFAEFSHIVCVAGYELEQSGKRLPGLALFNTVRQEIITRLECAKKSSTLGCWMLGSLLPFFSELIVTSAEFLPTEAVEAGKRRRNSASTNLASSGYLLVVLSDPGALRWLFRNFKTQEFSWLVMFRFQNCVPDIPSDPSSRLELCGVHRFTDPVASMCVAHPDMWLPGKLGEDLDPFKRPLAFVAVASRLVAYEIQYHPSNLGHDQIKFEPKTWYQTVDNVTSLSPLQDVVLAGSMAGVVAYGFKNIEGESMDATDVRDLKYLITFSRCSVTARPIKDLIPADAKGAHVLMGLEIGTSGRVSVFKYKANGNDEKTVMQEWMPQVTVGEPGLGMKCLPIARTGDGTEPRTLYMCTQHRGMWRFQMRELDSRTVETVLAIQKEASRHFAVGGCCYEDFRLGGSRSVYINPMPDVHDEADAGKPPAIVISRDFVETNEGDAREAINGPESSSSIISVGDDKQGGALLDGELLNAFVTAPLTVQEEILYKAGLLERGNSIGHDGAERLFSVTAFVIDVWNCIRS